MAAGTIIDDTKVVEARWPPGDRRMAIVAGIAAREMCWMFACRNDAIMAAVAGADNLCVVDGEDRRKDVGTVAVLANIAGLNVCQILADGIDTVMAVDTQARDVQVIKVGRQPGYR